MTAESLSEDFSSLAKPWLAVELDFRSKNSFLWLVPRPSLFEALRPWTGCCRQRAFQPKGLLGGRYEEVLVELLFEGVSRLSDGPEFKERRHFWPAPRESERFVGPHFFGAKIEVGQHYEPGFGPAKSRDWIDKRLRESFSGVLGPFEAKAYATLEALSAAAEARAILCEAELEAASISAACVAPRSRSESAGSFL